MSRKAKLEKALSYSSSLSVKEFKRLAPLHEALLAAIENLEDIKAWCKDRNAEAEIVNMKCLSLSAEALSKIDKVLGEM